MWLLLRDIYKESNNMFVCQCVSMHNNELKVNHDLVMQSD